MGYFYDFYKNLDMRTFTPAGSLVNRGQCGRFGIPMRSSCRPAAT